MLKSRFGRLFGLGDGPQQAYSRVGEDERVSVEDAEESACDFSQTHEFSWIVYSIFVWMGMAMLWGWNSFLAAAPYFQLRFRDNDWVRNNSQSSITSVFCITGLAAHFILLNLQKNASYPRRVMLSLMLIGLVFTILTISTLLARGVSAGVFFAFVLLMVFISSMSGSMNQNGLFAYVSGFSEPAYTQGILTGQALSGVLPCIVQLISVLAVSESDETEADNRLSNAAKSAFGFFATAVAVSGIALLAFIYLYRFRDKRQSVYTSQGEDDRTQNKTPVKKAVSLLTLFQKTQWLALAIFFCFCITMAFPVFASQVQSVNKDQPPPRYSQPGVFIALALLSWNLGDLLGRLVVLIPTLSNFKPSPFMVLTFALARALFIPVFLMCNVRGRGASINSDIFYLAVQALFGLTNGYICVSSMVGATDLVDDDEKEAAGAFMGMLLVAGLAAGSLLSFLIGAL